MIWLYMNAYNHVIIYLCIGIFIICIACFWKKHKPVTMLNFGGDRGAKKKKLTFYFILLFEFKNFLL